MVDSLAMFSGLECAVEKARGVHDVGNELVAGCATGAALAAGQGYQVWNYAIN
jgi:import inner membrane translocase subunit TIM22